MLDLKRYSDSELHALHGICIGLPLQVSVEAALAVRQTEAAEASARAAETAETAVITAIAVDDAAGNALWRELVAAIDGPDTTAWPAAIQRLGKLAALGVGYALATLGSLHEDGRCGLVAAPETAFELYLRGARGGDFHCMQRLGSLYERGVGVARDVYAAMDWYARAKEQNVFALTALLRLWHAGHGGGAARRELVAWHQAVLQNYRLMEARLAAGGAEAAQIDPQIFLLWTAYMKDFGAWTPNG